MAKPGEVTEIQGIPLSPQALSVHGPSIRVSDQGIPACSGEATHATPRPPPRCTPSSVGPGDKAVHCIKFFVRHRDGFPHPIYDLPKQDRNAVSMHGGQCSAGPIDKVQCENTGFSGWPGS